MRETATENNKEKMLRSEMRLSYLDISEIDIELTPGLEDLGTWSDSYTACSCQWGVYHYELSWNDIKGEYINCANH